MTCRAGDTPTAGSVRDGQAGEPAAKRGRPGEVVGAGALGAGTAGSWGCWRWAPRCGSSRARLPPGAVVPRLLHLRRHRLPPPPRPGPPRRLLDVPAGARTVPLASARSPPRQHLLGLATGVLVYWSARAGRRWVVALAPTPVLLDAYQIEAGAPARSPTRCSCSWSSRRRRSPWRRGRRTCVAIGLLLAAATLTRTVGQPLIVILAALVPAAQAGPGSPGCCSRRRWRRSSRTGPGSTPPTTASASSGANGVFLYARTMSFADCARMEPPAGPAGALRPPAARAAAALAGVHLGQGLPAGRRCPASPSREETDELAGRFASLAIRSSRSTTLASVLSELGGRSCWGRPVYPDQEIYDYYQFPAAPPAPPGRYAAQLGVDCASSATSGGRSAPPSSSPTRAGCGPIRTWRGCPAAAVLAVLPSRRRWRLAVPRTAGGGLPGAGGGPWTGRPARSRPVAVAVDDRRCAVGHPGGGGGVRLPLCAAGRAAGLPGGGAGLRKA